MATTEAQKRATQRYRERNREKTKIQSAYSSAKTYINKYTKNEAQLDELQELIKKRREELQEQVGDNSSTD
ncbi:hypothetical protein ACNAN0_02795 [Agrilactobacillus fermenti]|uniref:hypothetical protein n=1 Tax=Agrilactobacillus fermenti TaxID=2586909 RepID=UPI001E3054E5|nr:hypothetical protein [Agrilactobacillus fermenti]MCD2256353.1 hypothetical protein [Agrilactobacillus fermenti]